MTGTMDADTTMTATLTPPEEPQTHTSRRGGYWRLWRGLPRELAYLLIAFPISVAGFGVTITLFTGGAGMLAIVVGVFLIIGALYVARGFGTLDLALLEWTGRPQITRPVFPDAPAGSGFFGWLKSVIANGHYWLYLLYVMVVDFIVTTVTWSIAVTWLAGTLGGLTYWFWVGFIPRDDDSFYISDWVLSQFGAEAANPLLLECLINLLWGILFLVSFPFITRGLVWVHWATARGLLGSLRVAELEREVTTLSESRVAARAAEGHSLRRLERDIHDGPQQRLVRLQMDLAAAERQLDADPEKARVLIAEAMSQSKDALEELRALSRGFAPPILMDRGLVAALESQAARSGISTRVVSDLEPGTQLDQEIERNAYFVASEAFVNATKHSGATEIDVRVGATVDDADRTWLDVTVTDNGTGGAVAIAGHGIAGLEERLHGLGGILSIDSPEGGPTVVSARFPISPSTTPAQPL
ncbi:MAG: sensor histidine kinase [Rhodoglobus sp.]